MNAVVRVLSISCKSKSTTVARVGLEGQRLVERLRNSRDESLRLRYGIGVKYSVEVHTGTFLVQNCRAQGCSV